MIVSVAPLEQKHLERIQQAAGETPAVFSSIAEAGDALAQADILISSARIEDADIGRFKRLQWLFITSAGVETLPFRALSERGILVSNVSGIHGKQISEQMLGMMLMFSRCLHRTLRNQLQHKWDTKLPVGELTGKTLCIVGAGNIGREVARRAKAFDMRVTGVKCTPSPLPGFDRVDGMDDLYPAIVDADYVLLLTPLTQETYHLFGAAEFGAMKNSAVFLNASRGDTVDEAALIDALRTGEIAGAGLDVFHNEPLETDSPLWSMENVILTPHNSGGTPLYMDRAVDKFIDALRAYRAGLPLPGQVDLVRRY